MYLMTIAIILRTVNGSISISKKPIYVFFAVFTQKRPREKMLLASAGVLVIKTCLLLDMETTNSNVSEEEELFVFTPSRILNGQSFIFQLKRVSCALIST